MPTCATSILAMISGHAQPLGSTMRHPSMFLLIACGRNDMKHELIADIERADGTSETVQIKERTGYFHDGTGYVSMAWPDFSELGVLPFAFIEYIPEHPGPQILRAGELQTESGTHSLAGAIAVFEVTWNGGREFPILESGTIDTVTAAGDTVHVEFTAGPSNCMNNITSSGGCGSAWIEDGPIDVQWEPAFAGCSAEIIEAAVGTDYTGTISEDRMSIGDVELECEGNYSVDVMCGDDPFEVDIDGCTWTVFSYGFPANPAIAGNSGSWHISAGNTCAGVESEAICDALLYAYK
ncbi:MAG: hypothetical protein ACI8S6_000320 [Myxococcota bacterium]|jgi:hypothetical protein